MVKFALKNEPDKKIYKKKTHFVLNGILRFKKEATNAKTVFRMCARHFPGATQPSWEMKASERLEHPTLPPLVQSLIQACNAVCHGALHMLAPTF